MSCWEYIKQGTFANYLIYKDGLRINPRGKVITVALSTRETRFDVTFHMQLRKRLKKKLPSTEIDGYWLDNSLIEYARERKQLKEGSFSQYQISGICLGVKKNGLVTSCIIRNVLASFPFEYSIPVFSPGVNSISIYAHHISSGYRRAKRYILRELPPAKGQTSFPYALSIITQEDYKKYRQQFWN